MRAGQTPRGSSEFHTWGDSNLYLRRDGDELSLTVEHRAASAIPTIGLELAERENALALQVLERRAEPAPPVEPPSIDVRITAALTAAGSSKLLADLRALCRVRTATLYELPIQGRILRDLGGFAQCQGGQSSGPLETDRPRDAFTDDHIGLMDHLGIREFIVLGFCIVGPFIWNLLKRAGDRVIAEVPAQPAAGAQRCPAFVITTL